MTSMALLASATLLIIANASAQEIHLGLHAEEMKPFDMLHGEWRGTATTYARTGELITTTQTERVGPLLDGDILLIEGRSYDAEGKTAFNAFGTISYNPATQGYDFRAYSGGRSGTYEMTLTDTGFIWTIPAGSGEVVHTAVIEGDSWVETGEYVVGEQRYPTVRLDLTRIGDTAWPGKDGVGPK